MKSHSRKPKPVDQFKPDGLFIQRYDSANAAEKATGVNNAGISMCCNGKRKHAGGFIWRYANGKNQPKNNDLADLYDEIKAVVETYCILKDGYSDAVTLWILGCYFISEIDTFPRLVVTAPTKSCGKSQVLKVIVALTLNSDLIIDPTDAAFYRLEKTDNPIWAVDEVDEWLSGKSDATSILNAGFEKNGSVPRVDGNTQKVVKHEVFMPVALAGIQLADKLKDTTLSRSILLHVQKEKGGQYASSKLRGQYEALRDRACKAIKPLKKLYSEGTPPPHEDSRVQQVWSALYGIAELAGKLPEVNKSFSVINDNYENEDKEILLLKLAQQYIEHPKVEKTLHHKKDYVRTSSLFDLIIKDASFKESGININQNQFTSIIMGFDVNRTGVRFNGSSSVSSLSIPDLKSAFARYL